jgi:hypothetical protein
LLIEGGRRRPPFFFFHGYGHSIDMILRRVIEHVGKQQWTAIWIGLV